MHGGVSRVVLAARGQQLVALPRDELDLAQQLHSLPFKLLPLSFELLRNCRIPCARAFLCRLKFLVKSVQLILQELQFFLMLLHAHSGPLLPRASLPVVPCPANILETRHRRTVRLRRIALIP